MYPSSYQGKCITGQHWTKVLCFSLRVTSHRPVLNWHFRFLLCKILLDLNQRYLVTSQMIINCFGRVHHRIMVFCLSYIHTLLFFPFCHWCSEIWCCGVVTWRQPLRQWSWPKMCLVQKLCWRDIKGERYERPSLSLQPTDGGIACWNVLPLPLVPHRSQHQCFVIGSLCIDSHSFPKLLASKHPPWYSIAGRNGSSEQCLSIDVRVRRAPGGWTALCPDWNQGQGQRITKTVMMVRFFRLPCASKPNSLKKP